MVFFRFNFLNHYLGNLIGGMDFNPMGEIAATLNTSGVCIISDVNTDKFIYCLEFNALGKFYFQLLPVIALLLS